MCKNDGYLENSCSTAVPLAGIVALMWLLLWLVVSFSSCLLYDCVAAPNELVCCRLHPQLVEQKTQSNLMQARTHDAIPHDSHSS